MLGMIRSTGKVVGKASGRLVGGATKLVGKAIGTKWDSTGKWVENVGDSVEKASEFAFDSAGQFIEGASETTYGWIKKDDYYKENGIHNLKESSGKTIKGIGTTIKYTAKNAVNTYEGLADGEHQKALNGVKNIGKVAAVSVLAVGVIDFIDGSDTAQADTIETRNDHLAGTNHPETGIAFEEKTVEVSDEKVEEGVFPVFESYYTVQIQEDMYLQSDNIHFSYANASLHYAIENDPELSQDLGLTEIDMEALAIGDTPEGYTWHHHEEPGVLQLVDEETHAKTGHTGGREIWGGGSEYR